MAAVKDTDKLTYYINGEPMNGVYTLDTGKLTYYINGEPLIAVFPSINLGQFFIMF